MACTTVYTLQVAFLVGMAASVAESSLEGELSPESSVALNSEMELCN